MLSFERVVILADESANWKIAGLRQLDRLVFASAEFAGAAKIDIEVFWKPEIPLSERWLPERPMASLSHGARVVSTHLFVERNGLGAFFERQTVNVEATGDEAEIWQRLSEEFESACRGYVSSGSGWSFLADRSEIAATEKRFLRRSGKPQDGFVSRFINRPISRAVTRLLLKFPITPTAWTMSIFVLPFLACVFLLRGDYAGILIGTVIYQLYSILDGCDGEIARAKYLESNRGGRIDDLCDLFGAFVFIIGLGFGLSHLHWFYAGEAILLVLIIAANEWLLRIPKGESAVESAPVAPTFYPRHRRLIQDSGMSARGEKLVAAFVRLTKRDVGILFFVLLALAGLPQWILHLWAIVTALGLAVTGVTRLRTLARS